jgi:hypothetical protein
LTLHIDDLQRREHTLPESETNIIEQPAAGDNIASFKARFAAAYADSLRQLGTAPAISFTDELTSEQQAAIRSVIEYREHEDRRGSGNLLVAVRNAFHGKACGSLKRHFVGCERQLIGLAELMAAKDRERFVWFTVKAWEKNAKKRDGTSLYSRSYIWHRLQIMESLGLLTPATRYRNRTWRKGFLVTRHEDVARIEGERCVLTIVKRHISPRKPGEKRSGTTPDKRREQQQPNREQHREQYQEQQQPSR